MSLWHCANCKSLRGPSPGNLCPRCGQVLTWATVASPGTVNAGATTVEGSQGESAQNYSSPPLDLTPIRARLETARAAVTALRDSARTGIPIHFHQRDLLVLVIHEVIDGAELACAEVDCLRAEQQGNEMLQRTVNDQARRLVDLESRLAAIQALSEKWQDYAKRCQQHPARFNTWQEATADLDAALAGQGREP